MPVEYGSVTPSAAAVATAASAALPPALSTSIPTWLATASTDDTAPPPPRMTGTLGRELETGLGPEAPEGAVAAAAVVVAAAEVVSATTREPATPAVSTRGKRGLRILRRYDRFRGIAPRGRRCRRPPGRRVRRA